MKLEGKVTYEIETKEDLNELLSQLRFSFLPPMPDNELTQAGALIHDVRPHICILEFIKDRFKNIIYLRPDLNTQFNEVVDELVVLKDKFNSANEIVNYPPTLKRWDGLRVSTDVLPK